MSDDRPEPTRQEMLNALADHRYRFVKGHGFLAPDANPGDWLWPVERAYADLAAAQKAFWQHAEALQAEAGEAAVYWRDPVPDTIPDDWTGETE